MHKASQRFFTVAEVAERYQVNRNKPLQWIQSGALYAIDISQSQGERPRWRISDDALRQFEDSRRSTPATKRPARRKSEPKVREFIK